VQENVRFVPFLGELFGPTDDLYCVRDGCKALRHQGTKAPRDERLPAPYWAAALRSTYPAGDRIVVDEDALHSMYSGKYIYIEPQ
jgi:hypothetical protein